MSIFFKKINYNVIYILLAGYVLASGVSTLCFPSSTSNQNPLPDWINRYAKQAHVRTVNRIKQILPSPYAELVISVVLGTTGIALPQEICSDFQRTGLSHVLVASGAQVGLLVGTGWTVLTRLRAKGCVQAIWVWSSSIILLAMTGAGLSILRAVLMVNLSFLIQLLGRRISPIQVLVSVLGIMTLWRFYDIANIGFQLSFMATAALMIGVPQLESILPSRWPSPFKTYLSTVLAPFIWTFPIVWAMSYSISIYAIVANFLTLIVLEWLVWIGFVACIVVHIHAYIAMIPLHTCWAILVAMVKMAHFFASLKWGTLCLPPIKPIETIGLAVLLMGLFVTKSRKVLQYLGLGLGGLLVWICVGGFAFSPTLQLHVLDVGQGDSILICTPHHQAWLIDTGNRYAYQAILKELHQYGISRLDGVLITHPDSDHAGGLKNLSSKIPIQMLYITDDKVLDNLAIACHLPTHHLYATDTLVLEKDLRLIVLNPPPHAEEMGLSDNNRSVVTRLEYKHFAALLTGDLEESQEADLVNTQAAHLPCAVLKVGHHGSKTSSSEFFLNQVNPKIALISVGRHNAYHHPHPSVLARFQRHAIPIHRTDQEGTLTIQTDGEKFELEKNKQSQQ